MKNEQITQNVLLGEKETKDESENETKRSKDNRKRDGTKRIEGPSQVYNRPFSVHGMAKS